MSWFLEIEFWWIPLSNRTRRKRPSRQWVFIAVDLDQFDKVAAHNWAAVRAGNQENPSTYARRNIEVAGGKVRKQSGYLMHRELLGLTDPTVQVDHHSGDTLDNRLCNLRPATGSENAWNRSKSANNTTGFKGVTKRRNRWQAQIGYNGKSLYLGSFKSPAEAARAYDVACRKYHGKFARPNFPSTEGQTV